MQMLKKTIACALMTLSTHALAQTNAPQIDHDLVGTWAGEFATSQEANCSAYKWTMTRKADGTYRYHAYDDTQTVLDDEGRWWVDADKTQYFETVIDQSEEPTVYAYNVAQNNINSNDVQVEYNQIKPLNKAECSQTFHFSESKITTEPPKGAL